MIENTINPGRHRRQKADVAQRASTIRAEYARRREEAAEAARKIAFDRACLQAVIVGMKTALGFTVAECEQPVWPDSPWLTPKTFEPEFYERAMRYFSPAITEEFFHEQLSYFKEFWRIEQYVKSRFTMVEKLEFDGPWWRTPDRVDARYPDFPEGAYYFDMSLIEVGKYAQEGDDKDSWKHWGLKPKEEPVPSQNALDVHIHRQADAVSTGIIAEAFGISDVRVTKDKARYNPHSDLGMADKNQGYVPGEMWWNHLWARIKKVFTGE